MFFYFLRKIYPESSCSCCSYWWVHYWDSHGAQCSPSWCWWWPLVLPDALSSSCRISLIQSIFWVSLSPLPLRFTIVTSFVFSDIFGARSLTVYFFLAPVLYSFRPIRILRGLVIPPIAVHFLLTVFFLVVLSLPGRRRNKLQFPVRVQRLSCDLWIFSR